MKQVLSRRTVFGTFVRHVLSRRTVPVMKQVLSRWTVLSCCKSCPAGLFQALGYAVWFLQGFRCVCFPPAGPRRYNKYRRSSLHKSPQWDVR